MEIRIATQDDYDQCLDLCRLIMGNDSKREFLRDRLRNGRMYVTQSEDRIAGFVTFETEFIGCLYISLLMVHPDFRRRGIARRMIEQVASHSTDGRLFSSTEEDNDVSIKMHETLGFRRSGHVDNLPQKTREIFYFKKVD